MYGSTRTTRPILLSGLQRTKIKNNLTLEIQISSLISLQLSSAPLPAFAPHDFFSFFLPFLFGFVWRFIGYTYWSVNFSFSFLRSNAWVATSLRSCTICRTRIDLDLLLEGMGTVMDGSIVMLLG